MGGSRERSRTNSFTGSLASSLGLSQRGSIIELAREARELAREVRGGDKVRPHYLAVVLAVRLLLWFEAGAVVVNIV